MRAPPSPAPPRRLPVLDVRAAIAPIQGELAGAAARVLAEGRFVLGPEVAAFERESAAFLGAAHGVGVASGTDGLFLALRALGIGAGDEVLVPVFGFVATPEAVVRTGARPVFVDVRPGCGRVDLPHAARLLTARTRALVHVPLGGHGAGTGEASRFAAAHGLRFVEDAAQSFGARDEGRAIGTFGDAGVFSFFPAKVLGGFGDGGLVVTSTPEVAAGVRSLRQHGRADDGRFTEAGTNARLDELQAALLRVRLAALPRELDARRVLAARYAEALVARGLASPPACACADIDDDAGRALTLPPACTALHGLYTVLLRDPEARDAVRRALAGVGVDTAVYYARLLVDEPCFAAVAPRDAAFPGERDRSARALTLPFFPGMDPQGDVERVADGLAAALA